jgi:LuxR family transcriptional regulator, quorum-sensing system regulator CviR
MNSERMLHEPYDQLSGNDAMTLLEIIHSSLSCDSGNDFKALFPKIQRVIPFDFATAVLGHLDDCNGIVTAHHVNISFSEEWFHEYLSRGYLQKDTNVRENFTSYKLQNWTNVTEKLRQPEEIISLCMDFDMRQGYTCGSRPLSPAKNGSMFCFSGPSMECNRRSEAILKLVIPHLHIALTKTQKNKEPEKSNILLSSREKEVLNWLKNGKSSWEMSVILNISQSTVNFHVYNIMQKLGAINRPQAVAVATHLGIINMG